jgi:cytochrome c-type biogenesis protein CcmE
MASKKKNLPIYLLAFALFAGGVGFMMYSSLSENCTYHLNVSEAVQMPSEKLKSARLFGVAKDDIVKPANGLGASFTMYDLENPSDTVYVQYKGALPDTFEKGAEIIVEGRMEGKTFMAKTLMTKCPSKYEKSNREKA